MHKRYLIGVSLCARACARMSISVKQRQTQGKTNTSLKQELYLTGVSLKSSFRCGSDSGEIFLHRSAFIKKIFVELIFSKKQAIRDIPSVAC